MKANDFVFPIYQKPVGFVGNACAFCGDILGPVPIEDHVAAHAVDGDIERIGGTDAEPEYRPVFGKNAPWKYYDGSD